MTMIWAGIVRCSLGHTGWRDEITRAIALERSINPDGLALLFLISIGYAFAMHSRALAPDEHMVAELADAVRRAEESGDDIVLGNLYIAYGYALSYGVTDPERLAGLDYLRRGRDSHVQQRVPGPAVLADVRIAEIAAEGGDVRVAIESARKVVDTLVGSDERYFRGAATTVLVQSLLMRGSAADIQEAATRIDRLAAVPTDPGFVLNDIQLLRMRALLAGAEGDAAAYRDYRDRYRAMAKSLGFEGHIAIAEAML